MSGDRIAPDDGTDLAHTTDESEEDLLEKVHRMSRELGISLEEAERSVYSNSGQRPYSRTQMVGSIEELRPDMRSISLRARIITVHEGSRAEGGGTYHYGLMGDSGHDVNFCSWSDFPYSPGDFVLIQNGSVREWNGKLEVVIGDQTTVSPLKDVEDLLPTIEDSVPMAISELQDGMRKTDLMGRITEVREVAISVKGSPRTVVNGTLMDTSGRIGFTCWGPIQVEEGSVYRIIGGSVRSYQGMLKLNFDPGSILKRMSDDSLPPLEDLLRPVNYRVHLLEEAPAPGPVMIRGVVVDIRPGSGLVRRCNECGRKLAKGQCTVHGRVDGEDDLRLRALVDDGTGTIMARSGRDIVESVIGRELDDLLEEARTNLSADFLIEELKDLMVGKAWTLTGDPSFDDYGPNIMLSSITPGFDLGSLEEEVLSMAEVLR